MKKKILLDLERLRYPYSGIATVFRNLSKGIEQKNKIFEVTYYGETSGIGLNVLRVIKWKNWHKFLENFSKDFDVIHVSHQLSSYFQQKYRTSIKILTLHDLNFLHEDLSDKKRQKMLKKVNSNLKNTDYLICISQYAKEDVLKNKAILRLDNIKKIKVIHNGIELPKDQDYQLNNHEFLKRRKYILNIGVIFNKKKQMSLVEMLPFVDHDLVLVYSAEKQPYADNLRNKVKELDLESRVHFLPNVSEEEKYALIQNCEVMCHPSIAEGFGIPPIEAMSFGKPVFLSNSTSLPEIGGDAAYYFESFEPEMMAKFLIENLKKFETEKESKILEIKKWTKQFDYKVMAQNYLNFYEEILEGSTS